MKDLGCKFLITSYISNAIQIYLSITDPTDVNYLCLLRHPILENISDATDVIASALITYQMNSL